jgi:hypothetical protein
MEKWKREDRERRKRKKKGVGGGELSPRQTSICTGPTLRLHQLLCTIKRSFKDW